MTLLAVAAAVVVTSLVAPGARAATPIEGYVHDPVATTGFKSDICVGDLLPGSRAAGAMLQDHFGLATYGGYSCREMRNTTCNGGTPAYSTCWSAHATGRAVDLMTYTDTAKGNAVVNWLLAPDAAGNRHANARRLGVQQIIWNWKCWETDVSGDRQVGTVSQMRSCNNPSHEDHPHLTFTRAGAAGQTSWWSGSGGDRLDGDGDGDADLFAVGADGRLRLYRNGGSGTSFAMTELGAGWSGTRLVTAGDGDGDGDADLFAAGTDGRLRLYRNGGSGTSFAMTELGTGWSATRLLTAGDAEGDGDADLFAAGDDGQLRLYRNGGNGTGFSSSVIGSGWSGIRLVTAGDADGDGDVDLFGAGADGRMRLYRNGGDGSRFGTELLGTGWSATRLLTAGDADGDGDADLFAVGDDGQLRLYRNGGIGYLVHDGSRRCRMDRHPTPRLTPKRHLARWSIVDLLLGPGDQNDASPSADGPAHVPLTHHRGVTVARTITTLSREEPACSFEAWSDWLRRPWWQAPSSRWTRANHRPMRSRSPSSRCRSRAGRCGTVRRGTTTATGTRWT